MTSRTAQYAALAVVVMIGLLVAGKAIHEANAVEQARQEAVRIKRAESLAKLTTKAIDHVVRRKLSIETEIQACKDLGGVPITTLITGQLKRCDFPTKK